MNGTSGHNREMFRELGLVLVPGKGTPEKGTDGAGALFPAAFTDGRGGYDADKVRALDAVFEMIMFLGFREVGRNLRVRFCSLASDGSELETLGRYERDGGAEK